jgi:hypothetical protein
LNCGFAEALEFCPRCGQRNVPREQYDLRGLVGDYVQQVVSKLKVARTLWALVRHPGQLTAAFMDGRRIEQVNPLWMYLFVWTVAMTLARWVYQPESGLVLEEVVRRAPELLSGSFELPYVRVRTEFGAVSEEQLARIVTPIVKAQPVVLTVHAYTLPVVSLLLQTALARIVLSRSWLESGVYALHIGVVGILLALPASACLALFGMWGAYAWVPQVVSLVFMGLAVSYEWFAAKRVFGDRHPSLAARFILFKLLDWMWTTGISTLLLVVVLFAAAGWYGFFAL